MQSLNRLMQQKVEEGQENGSMAKGLMQALLQGANKVVQRLRHCAMVQGFEGSANRCAETSRCPHRYRIFSTLMQPLLRLTGGQELQEIEQLDRDLEVELHGRYQAQSEGQEVPTLSSRLYDVEHRRRLAEHCFHLMRQLFEERCGDSESVWMMALQTIERLYFDQLNRSVRQRTLNPEP